MYKMTKIYFITLFVGIIILFSGCIYTDKNINQNIDNENGLTFVAISDTHFGSNIPEENINKLSNSINAVNPEFVVISGDLMTADVFGWEKSSKIYENFRNHITVPIFELPGNHDAINRYSKEWIDTVNKPLYYSFDRKGIHFIMLADEDEDWTGTISDEQLIWFKNDIRSHLNETIIVFSHQPLPFTVKGSYDSENKLGTIGESEKILNITNSTKDIKLWFSGHHHFDSSLKPSIKNVYGITHVNIGSLLDTRGLKTLEMRIINIRKNGIVIKTYDVINGSILNNEYKIDIQTSLYKDSNSLSGSYFVGDRYNLYKDMILYSSSFENIDNKELPDGWRFYKTGEDNSTWKVVSDYVRDGKYAIKIFKYNDNDFSNIRTPGNIYVNVTSGQLYMLSAWYRSETEMSNNVGLSIGWTDKNGDTIKWSDKIVNSKKSWIRIDLISTAPKKAVKAELRLKVFKKSSIYWDQVEFRHLQYIKR